MAHNCSINEFHFKLYSDLLLDQGGSEEDDEFADYSVDGEDFVDCYGSMEVSVESSMDSYEDLE